MIVSRIDGFDWDDGNWPKCGKHGVSRLEIESLFVGEVAVYPQVSHVGAEQRLRAIGRNIAGRYLFVAFTIRTVGEDRLIRPISARYMHDREVRRYERG